MVNIMKDCETGKKIISPYIRIYALGKEEEKDWVALNTSSFEKCQEMVIKNFIGLKIELYMVSEVIGVYDRSGNVSPSKSEYVCVKGCLKREVVKEYLPKTFEYFENKCEEKLEKKVRKI